MDKTGFIGQGSYQEVSPTGKFNGGSALSGGKGREKKQPAFGQGVPQFSGQPHLFQRTGRTDDGRLPSPQKDPQAFLFNRGMKAADEGFLAVPKAAGKVKCLENVLTGASD
jgi:hypothetical protein